MVSESLSRTAILQATRHVAQINVPNQVISASYISEISVSEVICNLESHSTA